MLGLDPTLVAHHFIVFPRAKSVKQKLCKMHPQIALLVKLELHKFLDVRFIKPIDYPKWVSNLVPVLKPTGGIRICTDFRDLNKTFPKDDSPFPNIKMIVDLTVGHEMVSFMDDFSGYNQIKIARDNQHKTTFTYPWELFVGISCHLA